MTPEHATKLVARWARFYTRDLPAPIAERRIGEIDADLHDHIAHERARGISDRRIALGIVSRMVRGLPADASWHDRHRCGTKIGTRSIVRVALVTAVILLIPLVAMQFQRGVGLAAGRLRRHRNPAGVLRLTCRAGAEEPAQHP